MTQMELLCSYLKVKTNVNNVQYDTCLANRFSITKLKAVRMAENQNLNY